MNMDRFMRQVYALVAVMFVLLIAAIVVGCAALNTPSDAAINADIRFAEFVTANFLGWIDLSLATPAEKYDRCLATQAWLLHVSEISGDEFVSPQVTVCEAFRNPPGVP